MISKSYETLYRNQISDIYKNGHRKTGAQRYYIMKRSDFVKLFFKTLNEKKISYAVLHAWEELPNPESDIDIVIDKKYSYSQIKNLFFELSESTNWILIHELYYESNAYAYILINEKGDSLQFDFCKDYSKYGVVFFFNRDLLKSKIKENFFYRCSDFYIFSYCLIKNLLKSESDSNKLNLFKKSFHKDAENYFSELRKKYFFYSIKIIESYFKNSRQNLHILKIKFLLSVFLKNFFKSFFSILENFLKRPFQRLFLPVGVSIVFLGPDGVGKTSVIEKLHDFFKKSFRLFYSTHLFFEKKINDNTAVEPYIEKPYNIIFSELKVGYMILRYMLMSPKLFLIKIRLGFTTLERYYYDLLVDPERFRVRKSSLLLNIGHFLIPKPNLVIYLDAPAKTILNRKKELNREQIIYFREKYQNLIKKLPNGYQINADQPLKQVVQDCVKVIIKYHSTQH